METCPPRWCPQPNWDAPNHLQSFERTGALMGLTTQDWVRLVVTIHTELGEDGLPRYREAGLSVARQNGKTVYSCQAAVQRMVGWGQPTVTVFGAQNGRTSRRIVTKRWYPMFIQGTAMASYAGIEVLKGNEPELRSRRFGSEIVIHSGGESDAHGDSCDLVLLDEIWAHEDDRIEQAVEPTMRARPHAQLVWFSTEGTADSHYMASKVDRSKEMIEAGVDGSSTMVMWQADENAETGDRKAWVDANPGLGFTVGMRALEAEYDKVINGKSTEESFRRSVMNLRTGYGEYGAVNRASWEKCLTDELTLEDPIVLGIDANPERTASSIVAADVTGRVQVVECRNGADWLVPWLMELLRWQQGPPVRRVALLGSGAFREDVDLIERVVPVDVVNDARWPVACGRFMERALAGPAADEGLSVERNTKLSTAVRSAQKRVREKTWIWTRPAPDLDLSPLHAATLAIDSATEISQRPERKLVMRMG